MPRLYLAPPTELAQRLREASKGRGDSILFERQEWTTRAHGAETIDEIPPHWKFSGSRIHQLLTASSAGLVLDASEYPGSECG